MTQTTIEMEHYKIILCEERMHIEHTKGAFTEHGLDFIKSKKFHGRGVLSYHAIICSQFTNAEEAVKAGNMGDPYSEKEFRFK